jgi:hypothetical protein
MKIIKIAEPKRNTKRARKTGKSSRRRRMEQKNEQKQKLKHASKSFFCILELYTLLDLMTFI